MRTLRGWRIFCAGLSRMLAAVVIERLDQRRAGRHSVFAGERVVGKADQIVRAVEQPLGDQMRHLFGAALDIALDQDEPRAHHLFAELLHHLRPHHDIGDAGFVLQRHEDHALGAARTLPHQHHAGAAHAPVFVAVADRPRRRRRPRRQTSAAKIPSDGPSATAGWSGSRRPPAPAAASAAAALRLLVRLLARGGDFEQRQRHIVRQPPHRPQRGAAIEPDRAKRIGIREQDQRALRQAGVAGEILQRGEGTARPRGDDALGPVVGTSSRHSGARRLAQLGIRNPWQRFSESDSLPSVSTRGGLSRIPELDATRRPGMTIEFASTAPHPDRPS